MVIGVSVLLILVLIFLGLGVPLSFMIGSVYYAIVGHNSVGNFAYNAYYSIGNSPALLAIPLFLAAGAFIEKSGIAKVLIDLGDRMLYKIKGGMTATIPLVSCFFGALCGSGLATASVLSNMTDPAPCGKGLGQTICRGAYRGLKPVRLYDPSKYERDFCTPRSPPLPLAPCFSPRSFPECCGPSFTLL